MRRGYIGHRRRALRNPKSAATQPPAPKPPNIPLTITTPAFNPLTPTSQAAPKPLRLKEQAYPEAWIDEEWQRPAPPPISTETKALAPYIAESLGEPSTRRIFAPSPHQPTLRSDCLNKILIYRGAFNPPHLGHHALLQRAFESDLRYIAAIILPLSDLDLWGKMIWAEEKSPAFRISERARLWQGPSNRHEWHWVLQVDSDEAEQEFFKALRRSIEQDGFDLEIDEVLGLDYVSVAPEKKTWKMDNDYGYNLVCCDVTREPDFIDETVHGGLKGFKGFFCWGSHNIINFRELWVRSWEKEMFYPPWRPGIRSEDEDYEEGILISQHRPQYFVFIVQ